MPNLSTCFIALVLTSSTPLTARVLQPELARFSWTEEAQRMEKRIRPRSLSDLTKAREAARASKDVSGGALADAELCSMGNPTGDACRAAEKSAGSLRRQLLFLR